MNINKTLIALLRSEVCGAETDPELLSDLRAEDISELYRLSRAHDVCHLVGSAISKCRDSLCECELLSRFADAHMLAVFRYRRFADELMQISSLFESEGIEHIPLKGSVLRDYYPEAWMRTSCDIDILVRPAELDRAKALLEEKLGYVLFAKSSHDISLNSPTGVHLELHHTLIEDGCAGYEGKLLTDVWENTELCDGKRFTRVMTDSMFYFYHIVHMAKHLLAGGCGIKSVIDLWILENKAPHDKEKREAIISESGFYKFNDGFLRLSRVWFDGAEGDLLTDSLEEFILLGGVYGTVENGVSVDVVKKQGRLKYALSRIFPPYSSMKRMYPSLERHKWLLPFCHVRRWLRVVFCGGLKRAGAQFSKSKNISSAEIDRTELLLSELGMLK